MSLGLRTTSTRVLADWMMNNGFATGHGDDVADLVKELDWQFKEKIARLEKLVYVPGLWRCAKCKFTLLQSNLNLRDGTVTARDVPGDKCPNCHGPLWRVTERDAGNDMVDRATDAVLEISRVREILTGIDAASAPNDYPLEQMARDRMVDLSAATSHRDRLAEALRGAKGYLLNAKIDLETGAPKKTAIATIEGGLKVVSDALKENTNEIPA